MMKKTVTILFILLCLLSAGSCKKAFDPAVSQAVSRLEVHEDYNPLTIIRTDGNYTIRVVSSDIDKDVLGSYRITFEVSDGEHSKEIGFPVSVVDSTKPVLELIKPYEIETGTEFDEVFQPAEHFTAIDNYDGDIADKITYTGTVDTSSAGTAEIKVSVTDSSSNTTTMTVFVTVSGLNVDPGDDPVVDPEGSRIYYGPLDSSLVLYADKTFTLVANTCGGTTSFKGTYESNDEAVTLYIDQGYLVEGKPQSRVLTFRRRNSDLVYASEYDQCAPKRDQVYSPKD
ncbi:MAG: DUF5011 domain-containing protein [Erysipelotrichales bacterium]|nr:DUF5011 domain-containing protein [Erysipelotrichales bacterium]